MMTITGDGVIADGTTGGARASRGVKAKCECREGNAQHRDQQRNKDDAPIRYSVTHSYSSTPNKIVSWYRSSGFQS